MDFLEVVQKIPSCSLSKSWENFSSKKGIFRFWHATILENEIENAVMRIRMTLIIWFPFLVLPQLKTLENRCVPELSLAFHWGFYLAKTIHSVFVRGDQSIVHYSMIYYSFGIRMWPPPPNDLLRATIVYFFFVFELVCQLIFRGLICDILSNWNRCRFIPP